MAYRRTQYKPKSGDGRVNRNRIGWVRSILGVFEVRQFLPEDEGNAVSHDGELLSDLQIGPTIRLAFPIGRTGRQVTFNLTACTEKELDAIEQLFQLAINLARPVVQHRDEVARDALESGDDSYSRSYRQAPELVVRHRQIATYSKGVLHRPENVPPRPGGPGAGGDRDGAGGAGDGVADEAPPDAGPEDDGEASD